jgi:hypothetical protein
MGRRRYLAAAVPFAAAVLLFAGIVPDASARDRDGLGSLRAATTRYHDISVAEQHGYALLTDAKGIACIDMPGMGAMGVHWAKGSLVGDGAIVAGTPEALVYPPRRRRHPDPGGGRVRGAEGGLGRCARRGPRLFGRTFDLTTAPNRYGLPAFYSLHVWVWKHNPAGRFAMWNPDVTCRG